MQLQIFSLEEIAKLLLVSNDFNLVLNSNPIRLDELVKEWLNIDSNLYYRLKVFPINISPLRERREDIPILVEHFLRKGCEEMAVGSKVVVPEVMNVLKHFDSPGNIRELENTVKSLMITNITGTITLDSLPKNLFKIQPLVFRGKKLLP